MDVILSITMKKRAIFLTILCVMMVISNKQQVYAACDNVSQYGSITVKIPTLPTSGTYNVWTRMQIPDAEHSQYRLEINGKRCYEVGGSSITPSQWTWVSFQDGDLSSKVRYDFDKSVTNTAALIGTNPGVKIDRLLLIKTDCVPAGDGSNCQSDTLSTSAIDIAGATKVPPPSDGPVSGIIIPTQTISRAPATISKVIYAVDGKQIPTAQSFGIDTTLLINGSHHVAMQITMLNGSVTNEATTLTIENPQTALAPLKRWARLNQQTAVLISSVIGGILVLMSVLLILRHIRLQKRLLSFRGF